RRRHTRFSRDWSSDVCSSDLGQVRVPGTGSVIPLAAIWASTSADGVITGGFAGSHGKRFSNVISPEPTSRQTIQRYAPSSNVEVDRQSTRLNSSHVKISYAVF